ncbi:MAG: VOC family protein [Pseudomonadota bacterium]
MVKHFDRITLAVPDLQLATEDYRQLLDVQPLTDSRSEAGAEAVWFELPNTTIELVEYADEKSRIVGLVFAADCSELDPGVIENPLGLDLRLCEATDRQQAVSANSEANRFSVDHLVLRTRSAERCIEVFSQQLGIRLALDRLEPKWGGRMLFFRAGKLTLEVIEPIEKKAISDDFWGIAYACADLKSKVDTLGAQGLQVSEVRKGRKPGTVVATVKSHCLDIPTLLIGPA